MSTAETTVEALLQSVQAHRERRRLCGWNFNVFQLLQLEWKEDALHSRFIAELLKRDGSHGQGDSFLQLFLEQVGELVWKDDSRQTIAKEWIEAGKATVETEKSIGKVKIDGENSSGGRIDIFVSDGLHHLSIENKIRSGEGEKQVTRYCNYLPGQNFVLYLTLDGQEEVDPIVWTVFPFRITTIRGGRTPRRRPTCPDDSGGTIRRHSRRR